MAKKILVPGTLEGTFGIIQGRVVGKVVDKYESKSDRITVRLTRHEQTLSSVEAIRIGKSYVYQFEFPIGGLFSPAEFVSEKVTVTAHSALGASGRLRLDGGTGLELVREYFSVPAETLCDVNFPRGGNSRDHATSGWSYPETDFCWTADDDSIVRLPKLEKPGQHGLRLVAGALLHKPFLNSQLFQFYLNGELIATQALNEVHPQFFEAKFDGEPFLGQPLELRIHQPNAARPCELVATAKDDRRLALSVKRLTLVRFL